jgi:glutaconate CoA-transferase subunit B
LDFVTSPGHLSGGDARARLGLPGAGPTRVITDLALFDFANPEREMQLIATHPGVSIEDVRGEVGWDLRIAPEVAVTPAPTEDELHTVRVDLDPDGMYR